MTKAAKQRGSYSKIYKLDPTSRKSAAVQIKGFIENDFLVKYNANIDDLEEYRTKLTSYKGFNVYINSITEGAANLAILEYDGAFHVETFTFDMRT